MKANQKRQSKGPLLSESNISFRIDIDFLQKRAIEYFTLLKNCNLDFSENHLTAFDVAQELKAKIDQLCKKHLKHNYSQKIENLAFSVERVNQIPTTKTSLNSSKKQQNPDSWTHVAFKDRDSYLIGSSANQLTLFENKEQIYSGELPGLSTLFSFSIALSDMIYYKPMKCYLIDYDSKLYRKDVNKEPAYIYMYLDCGARVGSSFLYSDLHERLIVNKESKNIAVVNPRKKVVEIDIRKSVGEKIWDFKLLGERDERVVALTNDGYILLYNLNIGKREGKRGGKFKLNLLKERFEMPVAVTVCSKHEFICIEVARAKYPYTCSRMMVLRIEGEEIFMKAILDQHGLEVGEKYALACFGYFGTKRILFLGLSLGRDGGYLQVFDYDKEASELKELEGKSLKHLESNPVKVHKVEGSFYYIGGEGSLMKLCSHS